MAQFPIPWTPQQAVINVLGALGATLGFCMFAAPAPLFRQLWRARSTGEYDGYPYIATCMNNSLWILYGTVTPGRLAPLATNLVGLVVEVRRGRGGARTPADGARPFASPRLFARARSATASSFGVYAPPGRAECCTARAAPSPRRSR